MVGGGNDGDSTSMGSGGKGQRYFRAAIAAFEESGVGGRTPGSHDNPPSVADIQNHAREAEIVSWATIDETLNFRARRYPDKAVFVASRAGSKLEEYQPLAIESILNGRPVWIFSPSAGTFLYITYPQSLFRWLMVFLLIFAAAFLAALIHNQTVTVDQLIDLLAGFTEMISTIKDAMVGTP